MKIPFISDIIESVFKYFDHKQQIKAAEKERSDILKDKQLEAKLHAIENGQQADIAMDTDSRKLVGWMDDFSFFFFMLPVILAFFPGMVKHVEAGFEVIETMPIWYQYALGAQLIAIWGYRRLVTPIIEIIVKQYASRVPQININGDK